jgi:meiotically up-regulated gene 157 (Mug157) protein
LVKRSKGQQRMDNKGPYTFQRTTAWATDGVPLSEFTVISKKPYGLIISTFRPSDDNYFVYLIPSNMFCN